MKKIIFAILVLSTAAASVKAESIKKMTDRVFDMAAQQCKLMDKQLEENNTPRTYTPQGIFIPTKLSWWCSGFYPGTMWYIYEQTGDEEIKALAEKNTIKLKDVRACQSKHDVGFQYWCSCGNGMRVASHEDYLPMVEEACRLLASRFDAKVGCTRSWGKVDDQSKFTVIIDNMMNLELLMEGAKLFNCDSLKQIALTHANTTMANHFRSDYSSYHVLEYDQASGNVNKKRTAQGYNDESCWSRGEAWALYGYTMMYRESGVEAYLEMAENIAAYLLNNLPQDGVPFWDFNCPAIPYTYKDASAAAIMASAFVELSSQTKDKALSKAYKSMALKQIRALASDDYMCTEAGKNGCFLLRHSVGSLHGDDSKKILEIDAPLTYADYYFLEAILRYNKLYQ